MELHQIEEILEKHPSLKASKGVQIENLRRIWMNAKEELRYIEGGALLELKAKYFKDSQLILKAKLDNDFTIYQKRLEILTKETDYRKAEKEMESLDDEFTGVKKIVEIKRREMTL